jgi:hypothetical protein
MGFASIFVPAVMALRQIGFLGALRLILEPRVPWNHRTQALTDPAQRQAR